VISFSKNKFALHERALKAVAAARREQCRDWLVHVMESSSLKTRTKAMLAIEATQRFKVSKDGFEAAWILAIEEMGNRHWYEPLPKSRKKATKMPLA
jgi:hypothetical protein